MIYPRVILLKKSELRYQGAVSWGFILLGGIGTPVLLILLGLGLSFAHSLNIKSQLKMSQQLWENLEPRLESYKKGTQGLATNQKILDLFQGWDASRTSFVKLLDQVQDVAPESIQFSRLSVRTGASRPIYKSADDLRLEYSLILEGTAQGREAENQVISFQKDLLECDEVGSTFDSLKLASLRKRTDSNGENMREFSLIGETVAGDEK